MSLISPLRLYFSVSLLSFSSVIVKVRFGISLITVIVVYTIIVFKLCLLKGSYVYFRGEMFVLMCLLLVFC